MNTTFEFLGFTAVAAVVHVAVFAASAPYGQDAGGAGGDHDVTQSAPLAAGDAAISALVRQWDAPIHVAEPRAEMPRFSPSDAPVVLQEEATPAPRVPQRLAAPLRQDPDRPAPPSAQTPALFDMPQERATPRPQARPEPRQPSAPPASRAAGAAASSQQGQGQADLSSGTAYQASLMAQWGGGIRAAVQRQQSAPRTRVRGTVHLRLQVTAQGRLAHVQITQSSGQAVLDSAAMQAVQRARFPKAPSGIDGTHQFNLPLRYE